MDIMKDVMGRYRTTSLFWETRHESLEPLFTTKDNAHTVKSITYPSLKQLYLSYDHIPEFEYAFAMDVFNSWNHWTKLAHDSVLRTMIAGWRQELEIRIKADALKYLLVAARGDDAKGLAASRYLADKGYAQKRGRPSKDDVERERKIHAGVSQDLANDMERLGLSVIQGTK